MEKSHEIDMQAEGVELQIEDVGSATGKEESPPDESVTQTDASSRSTSGLDQEEKGQTSDAYSDSGEDVTRASKQESTFDIIREEMARTMFTSEMNLGGCGGAMFHFQEAEETMEKRLKENLALCASGVITGAGMFAESYFMFAIGNIEVIWHKIYPSCFDVDDNSCSHNLVSSFTYVEVVGVILGMLSFGYFADRLGRRWGSRATATFMFVGGVLSTSSYAGPGNLTGMFIFFAVSLFIFGYGVGGEYPLASASAAERAECKKQSGDVAASQIRGKSVVMVFAMQGWGSWVNTAVIVLLLVGGGCSATQCSDETMKVAWRAQYGIGLIFLLFIMVGRLLYLKESAVWLEQQEKKKRERQGTASSTESSDTACTTSDVPPGDKAISPDFAKPHPHRGLAFRYYWSRMLGTCSGWYVWDIVFYGNKLFQTTIISVIVPTGNSQVLPILQYTLLNASIAVLGYYAAALVIDKPWMGRRRLQNIGFLMTFVLFFICAAMYDTLIQPDNISSFQAIYYLSTFFGQFGPNATTWLLPSELFPTNVRAMAHGLSAASGKLGALTATILFTFGNHGQRFTPQMIFYTCACAGFAGLVITAVFIPDVTSLHLSELDRHWDFLRAGRESEYDGPANAPEFTSPFERLHRSTPPKPPRRSSSTYSSTSHSTSRGDVSLIQLQHERQQSREQQQQQMTQV